MAKLYYENNSFESRDSNVEGIFFVGVAGVGEGEWEDKTVSDFLINKRGNNRVPAGKKNTSFLLFSGEVGMVKSRLDVPMC